MDRVVCYINGSTSASYNKGGGVIRKNLLLIAGADNESAAMSGAPKPFIVDLDAQIANLNRPKPCSLSLDPALVKQSHGETLSTFRRDSRKRRSRTEEEMGRCEEGKRQPTSKSYARQHLSR